VLQLAHLPLCACEKALNSHLCCIDNFLYLFDYILSLLSDLSSECQELSLKRLLVVEISKVVLRAEYASLFFLDHSEGVPAIRYHAQLRWEIVLVNPGEPYLPEAGFLILKHVSHVSDDRMRLGLGP